MGQVIFQNPSFEGTPGGSIAPPGWSICSGSPDVQPSFFGTTQIPSDGNTYLGFHHDESVSAVFPNGIGICSGVQFNMDISIVPLDVPGNGFWVNNNMGVNPGVLCIYGGYGPCDFSELLWQSDLLSNVLTWETIQIQFTSTENFTHLNFAPCVNSPGNWTYFGIDNIQNVTTINEATTSSTDVTECDEYTWNGTAYTASGAYTFVTTNSEGCDSTATLNLTITNSTLGPTQSVTGCGSATLNGDTWTVSGVYTQVLTNAAGCDSTMTVAVTINEATTSSTDESTCGSYIWSENGQYYNQTGTYSETYSGVNGCDSAITLNLEVISNTALPPDGSFFNTGNNGNGGGMAGGANDLNWQVSLNDISGPFSPAVVMNGVPGAYYNSPWPDALWISYSNNGYHSPQPIDLYFKIEFELSCGDTCIGPFPNYTNYCLYLDLFADNSVNELYVNEVPQSSSIVGMPASAPYTNIGYSSAGILTAELCDNWLAGTNTVIVHVQSNPDYVGFLAQYSVNAPTENYETILYDTLEITICPDEVYNFSGDNLTIPGIYSDTLASLNGCDSIVTLILTNHNSYSMMLDTLICEGDTVEFGSSSIFLEGIYGSTFNSINGCDSVVQLDVNVMSIDSTYLSTILCFGEPLNYNNQIIDEPGNYIYPLVNVDGCDSIVIVDFYWNPIDSIEMQLEICEGNNTFLQGDFQSQSGVYKDTLININGCDSIITTVLTVTPLEPVTINYYICQGDSVFTGGNWKYAAGVYSDSLSTGLGCDSILITEIFFSPDPLAAFSFSNICENDTALFTDQSTVTIGAIEQWQWQFGNGQQSSQQQPPSQSYPADSIYAVQLTVTSDSGCVSTYLDTIEVYPVPIAAFTFDSVCYPLPIQFTDLSLVNGSYPITQWAWIFTDGQTSVEQSPQFLPTVYGAYGATLTVTNEPGCKSDTALGNALSHPLPMADFEANLQHCYLDTLVLTDLSIAVQLTEDTLSAWQYTLGDGAEIPLPNTQYLYSEAGFYDVQLLITTNHGCQDSVTRTVEVFPLPQVGFIAQPQEGCEPLSVQFIDTSSIPLPYTLMGWQWNLSAEGQLPAVQNPMYVYSPDTLGPFEAAVYDISLRVISVNGCVDSVILPGHITVHPLPEALFSTDPQQVANIIDPVFSMTDLSTANVVGWDWSFGDGGRSVEQNPLHAYSDTGSYTMELIVETAFGCMDTISYTVKVEPNFTFYIPNSFTPNADGVNEYFFGTGEYISSYQMEIYDRWGELIFQSNDMERKWDGTYRGKQVQQGQYVYKFRVTDWKNHGYDYVGSVYLHR